MHLNDWLQSQSTSTATPAAAQRCMKLSRRVCDCVSEHEVWQRGEKSEKGGAVEREEEETMGWEVLFIPI